jgi:ribonuclease D
VRWITRDDELPALCEALREEACLGLDVETTIHSHVLCLVQIASSRATYLLDAPELSDLEPLTAILANPAIVKVIHNASFERSVLGQHGLTIEGVVDTLQVSR